MAVRYRKKAAAREALLSVLRQAKSRRVVVPFSLPPDPLASLAKGIRKCLGRAHVAFREQKGDGRICFYGIIGFHGAVFDQFAFRITVTADRVSSYVTLPGHVPEKARTTVLEFLARVNWDLIWGGVKIDLRDGEVNYEIAVPHAAFEGGDMNVEMERLTWIPLSVFKQMASPLAKLMLGKSDSRAAFREYKLLGMRARQETTGVDDCDDEDGGDDGADDCECTTASNADIARMVSSDSASLRPFPKVSDVPDYAIDVLNVQSNTPLGRIIDGAKRFQSGNRAGVDAPRFSILLDGPPGSGKSCFARHLANQVGAPLIEARGSDLISSLVGQTEKNLAEAFTNAAAAHAVLFLDEIDSLLWSRAAATHAWEASEVNEMLGQLERASCIVIGATNYADRLDAAVARRFTFKVGLGYLTDHGKELLFTRMFKCELGKKQGERLAAIPNLCPGDYRTVLEVLYYVKEKPSVDDYLDALEKESMAKGITGSKQIGFNS